MSRSAAPEGEVTTPDAPREARQAALALEREQALGGEPGLQALELALQRADPRLLQVLDHQLVFAARLVHADTPAHQHLRAGARREAKQ